MSDHKPIKILPVGITHRQNKPWRFEQAWLTEDGCHEAVKAAWGSELTCPTLSLVGNKIKKMPKGVEVVEQ